MSKKIVAIGGGTIGEFFPNSGIQPYETEIMDREIIRLSDAPKPNILFIGFADPLYSEEYFSLVNEVYSKRYDCCCKHLSLDILHNKQMINEYFEWADAVYVGGGNTYTLMKILKKYGIDEKLNEAYIQGKVMSGISAGGICWFSYGNSVIPTDEKKELIKLNCLGFKNIIFAPHCDEINGHFENVENLLLGENTVGVSLSNACALEIVDDKYKIIAADTDRYKIQPFALKSFWYNGQYYVENIDVMENYCEYEKLAMPLPNGNDAPETVKRLLKRRNIYFK